MSEPRIEPVIEYLDKPNISGSTCNACLTPNAVGIKALRIGHRECEPPYHGNATILSLCPTCRQKLFELLRRDP